MTSPNPQQQELITSTDGIYLVDAGAGTGKTFTITRRYAHILDERDVLPDDVLLLTFTNNAAEHMREKIINHCDEDAAALRDAPISTFHSLCKRIIDVHGVDAPPHLGIDDTLSPSYRIMQNPVLERHAFERFFNQFKADHPEYEAFYRVIKTDSELLDLVTSLAAKGVFPTRDGWYQHGKQYLAGDIDRFVDRFTDANTPVDTDTGTAQSELRRRLYGLTWKTLPSDAPGTDEIRGGYGAKQIDKSYAAEAFQEDREELIAFIHDVYYDYIVYAVQRNYLNFGFLMMFAYVLLSDDHELRDRLSFDYVMIDEFQDTNEIQLKLALLFAATNNICVVGDWKQSIYSFQHAAVENIQRFEHRLQRFKAELNEDAERVPYPVTDVHTIELQENYRSTQPILEHAEQALMLEATDYERLDTEAISDSIVSLNANVAGDTRIEAFTSTDEPAAILTKIQDVVGNEDYSIQTEDGERAPRYEDIAVLARNRAFGIALQEQAQAYGIPVAYEGGIELFKTNPALIMLAWLRVLQNEHSRRGWAVILEQAGYRLDEAKSILDRQRYPDNLLMFRNRLRQHNDIGAVAHAVFDRYGFAGSIPDAIITELDSAGNAAYLDKGALIRFIEDNIASGETYNVDTSRTDNAVTVQTIHAAKGLEYPVVFVADLNTGRFPSTQGDHGSIVYADPVGLRQKTVYRDDHAPFRYDNWKADVLLKSLAGDYDEERRLYYVALTRAQQHLFLTAETGSESPFFTGMPIDPNELEPELDEQETSDAPLPSFALAPVRRHTPITRPVTTLDPASAHGTGAGAEHGVKAHVFAEHYVAGADVAPKNPDEERIKHFLDSLDGELITEQSCFLPFKTGDRRITVTGTIDLLHVTPDHVQIIDFKTAQTDVNAHYGQLSAYYHAVAAAYPEKTVTAAIFWTQTGDVEQIDPLSLDELLSRR